MEGKEGKKVGEALGELQLGRRRKREPTWAPAQAWVENIPPSHLYFAFSALGLRTKAQQTASWPRGRMGPAAPTAGEAPAG